MRGTRSLTGFRSAGLLENVARVVPARRAPHTIYSLLENPPQLFPCNEESVARGVEDRGARGREGPAGTENPRYVCAVLRELVLGREGTQDPRCLFAVGRGLDGRGIEKTR